MSTGDKALRLVENGKVRPIPTARVFAVDGDHDTYLVMLAGMRSYCECPFLGRSCSHVEAARLMRAREERAAA